MRTGSAASSRDMAHNELVLPEGCREAKLAVIIICMVGEVVQGELRG